MIELEEDGYNVEDRGVRSSNMYLQLIRKEGADEGGAAPKEAKVFRPAVAARLAHVKTKLEVCTNC